MESGSGNPREVRQRTLGAGPSEPLAMATLLSRTKTVHQIPSGWRWRSHKKAGRGGLLAVFHTIDFTYSATERRVSIVAALFWALSDYFYL